MRLIRTLPLGAISVLTFLLFLPTIWYALVYDDFEQIVSNPRLTAWSYLPGYFTTHLWAHSPLEPANFYRPVFLIWLRLVDAILGPPSHLWHLASIFAHVATTLCVFILIRRLTGESKGAVLAATLFAIHPVHTEAVAWVSAVSDPLLTCFLVMSMYFYIERKGPVSFVSLLFASLALFTKEAGIVAPALILAYEWTRTGLKSALAGAAPYVFPALLYYAARVNALGGFAHGVDPNMSTSAMILTWPRVLVIYLRHLVWPLHLSVCYDVPIESAIWPLLLLILTVGFLIWIARDCSANLQFGAAWFAITLAPALALRYLPAGDYVHDRYLYLPSVGLVLIAAVWLSRIQFTLPRSIAACTLSLALCCGTLLDLTIWRDDISLFRRAVETAPSNSYAKNNLADAYLKAHQEQEALPLLEQVIQSNPGYRLGYYNMARYYQQIGNFAEADRYFTISDQIYYSQQKER